VTTAALPSAIALRIAAGALLRARRRDGVVLRGLTAFPVPLLGQRRGATVEVQLPIAVLEVRLDAVEQALIREPAPVA